MNTYYCDGSTYKNGQPGQDSTYVVMLPSGQIIQEHIGNYSINIAELAAILHACTLAEDGDTVISDSRIAVNWCNRWKRTKNNIHAEKDVRIIQRIREKKDITILWADRSQNKAGIYLEENPVYKGY